MLRRKILDKLIEWKNKNNKKCLIIEGARQTGKTFIINHFGTSNYKNFVNINFLINKKYKTIFDDDLDAETIKNKIKLFNEFKHIEFDHNFLLYLDEIQECPSALVALKSLSLAGEFDVIVSGSHLGIKYKEIASFPVGYVETLKMFPLDFEEFMWANNISPNVIEHLRDSFNNAKPVESIVHNQMIDLFKKYIIVGGMPAVVDAYVNENKDIYKIRKIQSEILNMFFLDASKYASTFDKQKIIECINSIPSQLAKENKKFMFSKINKNARSKWYYSAISWLIDSAIANKCLLVTALEQPLNGYEDNDHFKLYLSDTGLLVSLLDEVVIEQIINDEDSIYKGAIFENIIAQSLVANEHKLRYFARNYSLEIDFIISKQKSIYALEIKSGKNNSKSLATIINENKKIKGLKISKENLQLKGDLMKIPWYLVYLF